MPPWKDSSEAMLTIRPPGRPSRRLLADELPRRRLRQEEHRLQVHRDHLVPVALGELERVGAADDAGVVHQDVDAPERRGGAGDHVLRRGGAQVRRDVMEPPPHPFHRPRRRVGRHDVDADDIAPGLRQGEHHSLAQPGVAAAHHGDPSAEVEHVPCSLLPGAQRSAATGAGSMSSKVWFSPAMPQMKL